jgi:hypothetical protein
MKKTNEVVVEVTFDEYKKERLSGRWPASAAKETVLMELFKSKGIRMAADAKPKQPVEIFTDEAAQKFVIKQIQ